MGIDSPHLIIGTDIVHASDMLPDGLLDLRPIMTPA
jgi:hypothetical protein